MSSILKALKKLENTGEQQTLFAESVDTRKTIRRSTIGTWLFYSAVSVMIVVGILIGGGWILMRQKPFLTKLFYPASSEEKKETPKPKPAEKSVAPPQIAVRNEPVIAKSSEIPTVPMPDKKPELLKETEKKPDPPKQRVAMPETPIIVPKPEELVIPQRPEVADIEIPPTPPPPVSDEVSSETEQALTDEVRAELAAAESAPQVSATDSQIPEKQIEGLGIQALVWSEDPKRRMVMMNNQILHIGDMIERFNVKDIGSDFVVLSEGTQEWKMRFHIK